MNLDLSITSAVYFYHDTSIQYEINHIMSLILHFRLILLIRNLLHHTNYLNPRAYRLG